MTVAELAQKLLSIEDQTTEARVAVMREIPILDMKDGSEEKSLYTTDPVASYEIKKLTLSESLPERHRTLVIGFEIPVPGESSPADNESPDDAIH